MTNNTFRVVRNLNHVLVASAVCIAVGVPAAFAQDQPAAAQPSGAAASPDWQYGGFVDLGYLNSFADPSNHLFRNRGTTPRVDEWDINMAVVSLKKTASDTSRFGLELNVQTGQDSKIFGFSPTAPNIGGADFLRHLGPTDVSYIAPVGKGLTIQGGIFGSLIGYDSLYAKDNFDYTRPWGADYTPYLMLGVNASYPMSERLTGTFGVVNGYFHLAHANNAPSFTGQLAYKPSDPISIKQTVLYGSHQASTALGFWRVLSDTIVERKAGPLTTAFEYQLASEKVDAPTMPRDLWMSAQLPIHVVVKTPWSVTVRPEAAWDRDGRYIAGQLGQGQSIQAVTTTLEYRVPYKDALGIFRLEYRYDHSHGAGGGFYNDGQTDTGAVGLTPGQNVVAVGLILVFDSSARP